MKKDREILSSPNIITEAMAMHVNNNSKKNLCCSHCKKTGHIKLQCYRLNGFPSDFKFTRSKKPESIVHNVAENSQSFTPEQYKQLMQLLNTTNNSSRVNSIITDGAMDSAGKYIDASGNHISYVFNVLGDSKHEIFRGLLIRGQQITFVLISLYSLQ